jgi:hypothetical protein
MTTSRNISIAIVAAICAAMVAQAALASGEPKSESPFTRQVGSRALARLGNASLSARVSDPRGESKSEWPFTRPVAGRALADTSHASRQVRATDPRGEPKNEPPFTRPVANSVVVVGAEKAVLDQERVVVAA